MVNYDSSRVNKIDRTWLSLDRNDVRVCFGILQLSKVMHRGSCIVVSNIVEMENNF